MATVLNIWVLPSPHPHPRPRPGHAVRGNEGSNHSLIQSLAVEEGPYDLSPLLLL